MIPTADAPSLRRKTYLYRTGLTEVSGRTGTLHSDGKPPITVNAPPEFKGVAGSWTPEELFVGSIEVCLMLTVVALAEKKGIALQAYSSNAEGLLEWRESSYEFTRVAIRPNIVVEDEAALAQIREVVERAHRACLVSNSVKSTVVVDPTFSVVMVAV